MRSQRFWLKPCLYRKQPVHHVDIEMVAIVLRATPADFKFVLYGESEAQTLLGEQGVVNIVPLYQQEN